MSLFNNVTYLVARSGCNGISSTGSCYTYFTSTGINWADARQHCVSRGYDLATVTSKEENALMYSTLTSGTNCWIGQTIIM